MAKGEGQVFNICQEREATGRVFPSGPGAAAVVTAACLPAGGRLLATMFDPWSPRSLEKLNSICLGWLTLGSRTVKSAADWPRICAAARRVNTTRTAQGTARGTATEPRGEPRHVS